MISEKRLKEISEYAAKYGRNATCDYYNIGRSTLSRYLRKDKEADSLPIDCDNDILFKKLSEKFSPGELKSLLNDNFTPQHGKTNYDFSGDVIKIGVLSDLHIGSNHTNEERIIAAFELFKLEGVSLVLLPGDITEGMSGRDGHVYELTHIGYHAQRQAAINILQPYSSIFDIKMISGNHDLWYASKANMGALIVKDICESVGAEYLGEHEAIININGVKIMLWHGEDGASYALSYRLQKIIESFTGGEKPNILLAGHDHKYGNFFIRNVHAVGAGCIQKQTPWMRRKRLAAYEGFNIIEATIKDEQVKRFKSEWIPFYV